MNGISDWYLRGHGFKYGTENRQPTITVRNVVMAAKISRVLSYFFTQRALESNS